MNYAILRVAKRGLGQAAAMARHALREAETPNADRARLRENTIIGEQSTAAVMATLRARTEPLAKRKDAVRCVELFIGASPEAMRALGRQQQDKYFVDALDWVSKKFGGDRQNVVLAVIHRDETTPHLQVLLTPVVDGRLAANRVLGGPSGLRKLQDDFAANVGAKHGLRRGERGSKARHTSVRQFYAAIEAAGKPDALPCRVLVPPMPEAPGLLASSAAREAHAKVLAERERAIEANRARARQIEALAQLGLERHGWARRRLPGRLNAVEQAEAAVQGARAVIEAANELLGRLSGRQQAEVLSTACERVSAERLARPEPKAPASPKMARKDSGQAPKPTWVRNKPKL